MLRNAILTAAFAGFTLIAPSALAQQAPAAPQWVKLCSKVGDNDICNVQYTIQTPTGQLVTGVNLLQSKGSVNRSVFQVAVPSGRYIPEGVKVQIDNGAENTLPYSLCLPDRCLAELPLSDQLVRALKGGGQVTLTSTNFQAKKNPIQVTLSGFTAAFDGPPLDRSAAQERSKRLADELKKKAEETRRKLEEAQKAAKSGSN